MGMGMGMGMYILRKLLGRVNSRHSVWVHQVPENVYMMLTASGFSFVFQCHLVY